MHTNTDCRRGALGHICLMAINQYVGLLKLCLCFKGAESEELKVKIFVSDFNFDRIHYPLIIVN